MAQPPGLFEVVRNKIRVKHYSIRTEKAYIYRFTAMYNSISGHDVPTAMKLRKR